MRLQCVSCDRYRNIDPSYEPKVRMDFDDVVFVYDQVPCGSNGDRHPFESDEYVKGEEDPSPRRRTPSPAQIRPRGEYLSTATTWFAAAAFSFALTLNSPPPMSTHLRGAPEYFRAVLTESPASWREERREWRGRREQD